MEMYKEEMFKDTLRGFSEPELLADGYTYSGTTYDDLKNGYMGFPQAPAIISFV